MYNTEPTFEIAFLGYKFVGNYYTWVINEVDKGDDYGNVVFPIYAPIEDEMWAFLLNTRAALSAEVQTPMQFTRMAGSFVSLVVNQHQVR